MENYNAKDLYIKFYHGDIKNLSDGTLRKLLREFSKLTHEILLDEIDFFGAFCLDTKSAEQIISTI